MGDIRDQGVLTLSPLLAGKRLSGINLITTGIKPLGLSHAISSRAPGPSADSFCVPSAEKGVLLAGL